MHTHIQHVQYMHRATATCCHSETHTKTQAHTLETAREGQMKTSISYFPQVMIPRGTNKHAATSARLPAYVSLHLFQCKFSQKTEGNYHYQGHLCIAKLFG